MSVLVKVKVKGTVGLALLGCSRELNQKYRSPHCRTDPYSAPRRPEPCLVPSAPCQPWSKGHCSQKTSVFKPLETMPLVDLLCTSWIRSLTVFSLSHNQYLCLLLYRGGSGMFSDGIMMLRWDRKSQWMIHLLWILFRIYWWRAILYGHGSQSSGAYLKRKFLGLKKSDFSKLWGQEPAI